jgi:hypothetical protein
MGCVGVTMDVSDNHYDARKLAVIGSNQENQRAKGVESSPKTRNSEDFTGFSVRCCKSVINTLPADEVESPCAA